MAIFQNKTFADIIKACLEELRIPHNPDNLSSGGDQTVIKRVKRAINSVYLNEVAAYDDWRWLRDNIALVHDAKITAGTASVTQNSRTVTLTIAPANSQKGNWFRASGWDERYRIAQHVAGSTTLVLQSEYTGSTAATSSYTLWSDRVILPSNCRQTQEITQDFSTQPLEGVGIQKFRQISNIGPLVEGRPGFYSTGDFIDPDPYQAIAGLPALSTRASSGFVKTLVYASDVSSLISVADIIEVSSAGEDSYNGNFVVSSVSTTTITYTCTTNKQESATADATLTTKKLSQETNVERAKELLLYPAIFDKSVTLHVDYLIEPQPLENDTDEPLMPIEDRQVLVYGALMILWRSINGDTEQAAINTQLYDRKLSKMQGKVDDSTDFPTLTVSRNYLQSKRKNLSSRFTKFGAATGGGGGSQTVSGTANAVAIYDANGKIASSASVNSTELSYLDGSVPATTVALNDNQGSAATILSFDGTVYNDVRVEYQIRRGSDHVAGQVTFSTDLSSVAVWANLVLAVSATDTGVTLAADTSGNDVLLQYTSTSTGTAPTIEFRIRRM